MPDLEYDRPAGRRRYLSIAKHMRVAQNTHNKWIGINIEREVFDNADYGNFDHQLGFDPWMCDNGTLWGLERNRGDVGMTREQFGYFEPPTNPGGEWHGFPIVPFSRSRYHISDELLLRWVDDVVLQEDDIPAIKDGRRI